MWKSTRLKISLLYNNTSEAIKQGRKELFMDFLEYFRCSSPYIYCSRARVGKSFKNLTCRYSFDRALRLYPFEAVNDFLKTFFSFR